MATLSSHTLNGIDGTHAGGIAVKLVRISDNGSTELFAIRMDDGGRLSEKIDLAGADPSANYELSFDTGAYWQGQNVPRSTRQIMREVVIRFQMPDPEASYHIPVILSPNSYSVWWSS